MRFHDTSAKYKVAVECLDPEGETYLRIVPRTALPEYPTLDYTFRNARMASGMLVEKVGLEAATDILKRQQVPKTHPLWWLGGQGPYRWEHPTEVWLDRHAADRIGISWVSATYDDVPWHGDFLAWIEAGSIRPPKVAVHFQELHKCAGGPHTASQQRDSGAAKVTGITLSFVNETDMLMFRMRWLD